jgi:LmbE family N-acetylglucosaminyl deacetylase
MAVFTQKVIDLKLTPDLIITHADTDLNLDHRITCNAAKILGRPRRKPVSILASEIPSTSFWNGRPFQANYFVDISDSIEVKVQAFEQYVHEIQAFPSPWSSEGLRLLARYHGMECGFPYAEAFSVIRAYEGCLP